MPQKKKISILGSTGSIGTQTIEVVESHPDLFEVVALCAGRNVELLAEQCRRLKPRYAAIADEKSYPLLKDLCKDLPVKLCAGQHAIGDMADTEDCDTVVAAMVGYAGLYPTLRAAKAGKTIALANKESLVVAGELVTSLCKNGNSRLLPVDSEHSAIFQCLQGNSRSEIEKLILTASGGPFRKHSREMLQKVTKEEALRHPNWKMGAKITIDSATMMNKGFEVIEARWLFDTGCDKIDVLVHPQSIVHSMVQFRDGAVLAQMGTPDMKLPIQYALCYPERKANSFKRLDLAEAGKLEFEKPDMEKFRNLALAYAAIDKGGNAPCVLNAANEVAVAAFLQDKISFLQISDIIEKTLQRSSFIAKPAHYSDYVDSDNEARRIAEELTTH